MPLAVHMANDPQAGLPTSNGALEVRAFLDSGGLRRGSLRVPWQTRGRRSARDGMLGPSRRRPRVAILPWDAPAAGGPTE
jgi:hypothetical protein